MNALRLSFVVFCLAGAVRMPAAVADARQAGSFRLLLADGTPVVTGDDLVGYSWPTHTMILKPGVVSKLRSELKKRGGLVGYPFKVEADGVVCYEGVFTTSMSSSSQWRVVINLDPLGATPAEKDSRLSFTLGYPTKKYFRGKDPRGDARIRTALESLDKLKLPVSGD